MILKWGTPKRHDGITNVFIYSASASMNNTGHGGKKAIDQLFRGGAVRKADTSIGGLSRCSLSVVL